MLARYFARRAMRRATARAAAYRLAPYSVWCVHTQLVLDQRARAASLKWARR